MYSSAVTGHLSLRSLTVASDRAQSDFLAKENMVRCGINVSRQRGDMGPSKGYRNALEMVKYQAKGLY